MGRTSRSLASLGTAIYDRNSHDPESDVFPFEIVRSSEDELEQRRSELRNGLTHLQRLFLFGKLSELNDKDAH